MHPPPSWKALFGALPPSGEATELRVSVLRKSGEPLLILPRQCANPGLALQLYPAQSWKARLARQVWQITSHVGFIPGAGQDRLTIARNHPFPGFLRSLCAESGEGNFALLAGNPRGAGRRFVLLLMDGHGQPAWIVKAGADEPGNSLILREADFLSTAPRTSLCPRLGCRFSEGRIAAFAMEYAAGRSARGNDSVRLLEILHGWISSEPRLVAELTVWRRLKEACPGDPVFQSVSQSLEKRQVSPALYHGDLAPWNVRIATDGSWKILDWERGELNGPPGWDWFHYILQPAILVRREPARTLAGIIASMLDSAGFQTYATAAGLRGVETMWLLAYLLHCRDVLRPADAPPTIGELIPILARKLLAR